MKIDIHVGDSTYGLEVPLRNVEISRVTQHSAASICSKSHDFLAVFALAHSKINQIA